MLPFQGQGKCIHWTINCKHNFISECLIFFYLHPTSKMITTKKKVQQYFFFPFAFQFLQLVKTFCYGHFHFFLKMVTLFPLKINIDC